MMDIRSAGLHHGAFYEKCGYKIALPLTDGVHFEYIDDEERPWMKWDRNMLAWLKENAKDEWANLESKANGKRYILFKDSEKALKWKLIWG